MGETVETLDVQAQRKQSEQQARPEVEKQRKEAEEEARETLVKEATEAIALTRQAVNAISAGKTDEALAAIEQATGKINVLLARNPATALIPVELDVAIIDTAPRETQSLRDIATDASNALDEKDYPTARTLLSLLMSEIRVRTYHLPLATYPDALKEAACLLDQKETHGAISVLSTALNTLAVLDRVTPLPLLLARAAINQAQAKRQEDKSTSQALLQMAKREVTRAKELGYAAKDEEYEALHDEISSLEKQVKGNEDVAATFSRLKEKLSAFLKRQSERKHG